MQVLVPDYLVDYFQPRLAAFDPDLELISITAKGEHTIGRGASSITRPLWPR